MTMKCKTCEGSKVDSTDMKYRYFVSYFYGTGTGMSEIARNCKITTFEDVVGMAKCIKESSDIVTGNSNNKVVIINYQIIE